MRMARFISTVTTWAMACGPSAMSCSMTAAMIVSLVLSGIGRSFLAGGTPHTLDLPVVAPRGDNRQPPLHRRGANFQTSGYTTLTPTAMITATEIIRPFWRAFT